MRVLSIDEIAEVSGGTSCGNPCKPDRPVDKNPCAPGNGWAGSNPKRQGPKDNCDPCC
jgi:hypothetical protein